MAWKDTLRESLAAVGVVGGLLFVGYETSQNTAALRSQTLLGTAAMSREHVALLVESRDLRDAWTVAITNDDPEALTEDQQNLLAFFSTGALRVVENRFRQAALGAFEGAAALGGASSFYSSRYFRDFFWANARQDYPPDFTEWFDREVMSSP